MTSTGDDEVDQLLGARGIKYSHQNDKMIAENPAEKERIQQTVKVRLASSLTENESSGNSFRIKSAKGRKVDGNHPI
jgi:hypothetical protein